MFGREGFDLTADLNITLKEALAGFSANFTLPTGRVVYVNRTSVTESGAELRVPDAGLPVRCICRLPRVGASSPSSLRAMNSFLTRPTRLRMRSGKKRWRLRPWPGKCGSSKWRGSEKPGGCRRRRLSLTASFALLGT